MIRTLIKNYHLQPTSKNLQKLETPLKTYIANVIRVRNKELVNDIFTHLVTDTIKKIDINANFLAYIYATTKNEYLALLKLNRTVNTQSDPFYRLEYEE